MSATDVMILICGHSNLQAIYKVVVTFLMASHSTLRIIYLISWLAVYSLAYYNCMFSSYQLFEDCY